MKWLALGIILIGLGVISYPFVEDQWASYKKDQYIQQFESGEGDSPDSKGEREVQIKKVNDLLEAGERSHSLFAKEEDDASVLGTIEIPTIQLKLPVLQGASDAHLKYGVGHLNGTAPIGHHGNAALAAHRGYRDGKLFNRLDEVKEGDSILFHTTEGEFEYEVQHSFLVTPENLSVLNQSGKETMVTLITCDPVPDPTHRLIVKAVLIDE
ncbi:sortase A [Halobacillus karajensis]|uniref:Sortase n=1 Tax=Halobacillus karajensis TaxID=195088 RepID=A0A024P2U9_9BACI|nr:class D sortase [Halobacillus karajensis]CDQ19093.1 sortase [Halobacillus karajensis]CDQ22833.1 sortase [Halobacillus karajensis]CDQ26315.1 sortase [Halobacillus karajensis]SEH41688.1 sortase A [Halobacillus karajensis]